MKISDLQPLLNKLIGEAVTSKTIAGNSILLWLAVDPKSESARCLWIDPPWRIETPEGIESSSLGFPKEKDDAESDDEYRLRFEAACASSDCLKGSTVISIAVESLTGDLAITFKDDRVLRMFAVDVEYENWHYTDYGAKRRYGVWAYGVENESFTARKLDAASSES
jgi:hypothetical protein